jgi:triacylglycerol lipase
VYEEMVPARFLGLARRLHPGFVAVRVFDEGNAQAAVFEHEQFIAVVFRGTSSDDPGDGSDWGSNLEALMELVEILHLKGRVHTGFWRYADMLWEDGKDGEPGIKTVLGGLMAAKKRPIMVAGHSLGGAAAVLGAMRVISLFETDEVLSQLVTFGQPRCVGHQLAQRLTDTLGPRYCRVVRGVDIVPMVPPSVGYAHAGQLYYINEDETIVRNPSWLKQQLDRLVCWWSGGGGWFDAELSFVSDHDMTDYWRLVRDSKYEHEENAIGRS